MSEPGYLYVLTNPHAPGLVKIGRSANPWDRTEALTTTGVPGRILDLCMAWHHLDVWAAENGLKQLMASVRIQGSEWFVADLNTVEKLHAEMVGAVSPPTIHQPAVPLSGLGSVVRFRRRALGLNQAELADLANVSERFVYALENGKLSSALDKVQSVLDALGMYLFVEQGRR